MLSNDAGPSTTPPPGDDDAGRRYLDQVRREIDEEVRRRASGDLPPQVERELDELFLRHAPYGARGSGLRDMLRQVDAAVFIDPMVPIASRRPGGTAVKRGLRSLSLWYLRYVTYQVSSFATAVSRALHVLDLQMSEVRGKLDALEMPPSVVVDPPWAHRPGAWWATTVAGAVAGDGGRVLHAACGDGWLVAALAERGVDAYGVDPRPGTVMNELDVLDLREEDVAEHLEAVEPGSLGAVVLSGVVEGAHHTERLRLLAHAGRALSPDGVLFVHCLSRSSWDADDAPVEADLVPARPYRPATWPRVLGDMGLHATVDEGPDGRDYLVTARRRGDS